MQPFDRFWWNLARWRIFAPYSGSTLKILNFWMYKMAAAAILKITKIAKSPHRFDRSLRNFVRWCKIGLLTASTVKNFELHKSKMADGRHFENRKITISLQPCDRLWWNLAQWHMLVPYGGSSVKISNTWKSNMVAADILKENNKNRDISATVWPIFTKFRTLMQNGSLNLSNR